MTKTLIRQRLEYGIINICLHTESAGYASICNILTPKSFRISHCSEIWRVMEELYPTEPINLMTVAYRLSEKQAVRNALIELSTKLPMVQSLAHQALLLVQFNIEDDYVALLKNLQFACPVTEPVLTAAYAECINYVQTNPGEDIFNRMHNTKAYLLSIGAGDDAQQQFDAFQTDIEAKVLAIKKGKADVILSHLLEYSPKTLSPDCATAISQLAEVIAIIHIKNSVPASTLNAIDDIKNNLYKNKTHEL